MNLADAIRQASTSGRFGQAAPAPRPAVQPEAPAEAPRETPKEAVLPPIEATPAPALSVETGKGTEPIAQKHEVAELLSHPGQGLVRLELFVHPDQLDRLIQTTVSAHHSILTAKEAASHLRISAAKIEEMASERKIPAFKVDGRWRFSKVRLDEWIANDEWEKEQVS